LPIIARTTTERPAIVVIPVARSNLGLAPVVIPVAIVRAAAASTIRGTSMPLVAARVKIARIEIKHAGLPTFAGESTDDRTAVV
jgi:hypothetical protein